MFLSFESCIWLSSQEPPPLMWAPMLAQGCWYTWSTISMVGILVSQTNLIHIVSIFCTCMHYWFYVWWAFWLISMLFIYFKYLLWFLHPPEEAAFYKTCRGRGNWDSYYNVYCQLFFNAFGYLHCTSTLRLGEFPSMNIEEITILFYVFSFLINTYFFVLL